MIKIDFSKFPMYADIEHSRKENMDIRKGVANRIYTTIAGIAAAMCCRSDADVRRVDTDALTKAARAEGSFV